MMMVKTKLKILVVDDAQLVVKRVMALVNELPSVEKVIGAASYNQAVQLIKNEKPHLVLLDIQLPEKNGIELLVHVKKNYPEIKTIMLTNKAGVYYKNLCEKNGCDHFIDKSSEFEKIPMIIESYSENILTTMSNP